MSKTEEQKTRGYAVCFSQERLRSAHLASLRAALYLAFALAIAAPLFSQGKPDDITSKSLEELMDLKVSSASKKEQSLAHVAAAIFVITQQDIQRSGATNIPDLLRMVPGMNVAQIDANTWAISARGFNEQFSDKLLVMVDGRSVYTVTFGGVFWDVLDLPLEDIERIEVIRGPGGAIWGSNAVNGIINIISKPSQETQGTSVVAGGGNTDQGFGTLQYGGAAGKSTTYRAYVKYLNQSQLKDPSGNRGGDGWHMVRGGSRFDTVLSPNDHLTFQGDVYAGAEGQQILPFGGTIPIEQHGTFAGGYVQSVWDHDFRNGSRTTVQASFDRVARDLPFRDARNRLNLELEYHAQWGHRQDIVLGGNYLYTNHLSNSAGVTYDPVDNGRQIFSAFVQDEVTIVPQRLFITPGVRLEHNEYTGFLVLPNIRAAWHPGQKQTIWAAVSSTKRMPASGDTYDTVLGIQFPDRGTTAQIQLLGNPRFKNEELLAYEAGYRAAIRSDLTIDLSLYYNSYSHLRTIEPLTPFLQTTPSPPVEILPVQFENLMYGETHGLEVSANWKITSRWTLSPGYAFERVRLHLDPSSQDTTLFPVAEGGSPDHSAQLRSHWTLGHGLSWDASAYFVSRLKALSTPSYTRVDSSLTWSPTERSSFNIVGQDLLRNRRLEYRNESGLEQSGLTERSVYGKVSWRF